MPWDTIIVGVLTFVAAITGSWLVFRGKKVEAEVAEGETEANAADAWLKGQASFQKYVDDRVDERVAAAIATMQGKIDALAAKLKTVSDESHEMNDAIRSRETQLWLWNIRDRPGPMPELPEPILHRLGIGHLRAAAGDEDTQPL